MVRTSLNNSRTENWSSALFFCHRTASPWAAKFYLIVVYLRTFRYVKVQGVIHNWEGCDRFQSNCRYKHNVLLHAYRITTKCINQYGQCEVRDSIPDAPKYGTRHMTCKISVLLTTSDHLYKSLSSMMYRVQQKLFETQCLHLVWNGLPVWPIKVNERKAASGDFCATLYTFLTCSFNTSSPYAQIFPPPRHFYLVSSLILTTLLTSRVL